jgi:hypothetical protein
MCNPGVIGGLLTVASIAIVAAIVLYIAVAAQATSWWTSGANFVYMGIAGALIAVALGSVGGAIAEASKCSGLGPCQPSADAVYGALVALQVMLTSLLIAGVIAAIPSSIPWVGIAIGIAFAASALAAMVLLAVISVALLPALDACLNATASPGVTVQTAVGIITGLGLLVLAFSGGRKITKDGVPPEAGPTPPDD